MRRTARQHHQLEVVIHAGGWIGCTVDGFTPTHEFVVEGSPATRIVLGDWYDSGSVLRWGVTGFSLETLARA